MPLNNTELIKAAKVLSDNENLRVTVNSSGKGALICAGCSFAGGLLLGPAGLAIGGTIGGLTAYTKMKGKFQPLSQIISELSPREKEKLCDHLRNAIQDLEPADAIDLIKMLAGSALTWQMALNTITSFIANETNYSIASS